MTVTASNAVVGVPFTPDDTYVFGNANTTGNIINPGDYIAWSGSGVMATEDANAWYKVSGIGIALDRNPAYDRAGRIVVNSAVVIATRGIFMVSASFSGRPLLGVGAYPVTTGSGVNSPTGVTGVAATWNTASPVQISANPTGGTPSAVATVIGSFPSSGVAGTGQLLIRLLPPGPTFY